MDPDTPDSTRPFQWAVVLVGVAGFVALALMVHNAGTPLSWERPIITAADRVPMPFRDILAGLFEPIPFALITLALAFAAAARGRGQLAIPGLGGCLAAVIAAELVLKPVVDRMRARPLGLHHHLAGVGGPMFPSAHVTAAAAWATFAWLIVDKRSRLKPFIVALPLVVGWAVISKKMHYPADVIGGLILGPTVVYCTVSAVRIAGRFANTPIGAREPERVSSAY